MSTNKEKAILEQRISELEKENSYLKSLLDKAGISYSKGKGSIAECNLNQGKQIITKTDITELDARRFFSYFWGRMDLYSQRTITKSTGAANYYPQCYKIWKQGCPKKTDKTKNCKDCANPAFIPLGKEQIIKHLKGVWDEEHGTDTVIGVYPLFPDDTCRFIVFDFDNHEKGANKDDFANVNSEWKEEIDSLRRICEINHIPFLVERSRSGRGAHLWIFFEQNIEAKLARKFGNTLLGIGAEAVNLKSFRFYDRMLPMQDHMPKGGFGNLIALPLQGKSLENGNSAFVDENWNAYADQWKILFQTEKLKRESVENRLKEWQQIIAMAEVSIDEIRKKDGEKPWNRTKLFHSEDVNGKIEITLADAIYIEVKNLRPRIQNQIREMAAFSNPVFYKNQAMGLSNYDNARYIYLGKDTDGYIRIPRGLLDSLIENAQKAKISYHITDKRCMGRNISVQFSGDLKESQIPAVKALEKQDTGILNAATAFGKTVVCCNLITKKQVNTLILLQSSALMEQWEKAIDEFLEIEGELPEYKTPSGRIRKRKSLVGKLQGAHDSTTGIIDIAMVGSLCKKGEFHPRLKEYGMVILDECHHAASDTIVEILNQVNAKYVYGVTATPFRGDGLEKINYMMLGPIRFKFTSKDRAKEQGIGHFVYPRFTRTVAPRFSQKKMHPNEAYELIRNNEMRDELIVSDVKRCIDEGRTPVVLSKYVDHSRRLYNRIRGYADKAFLLSGENSKKEHKLILEEMNKVQPDESMVLVATGKLVGEGFDFPRLDTLIMAAPVAWKGIVEQYAGRLNRDYEGKKDVIVYDYVDRHIPMFDNMYHKRLKAYRQIGYEIYSGSTTCLGDSDDIKNAIYDSETYFKIYAEDLLNAKKEIIISSPAISGNKVDELIQMLNEKITSGVHIVIVTWKPDNYGYGDSEYWMELHERMRNSGFEMNLVEEDCEHYCLVDREIVWYGSVNFLGKPDIEDNLMRVCSRDIAEELMELTFKDGNTGERL